MTPLTLEEFGQELRRTGDWRTSEFGDEILMLLDLEEEVAEPYSELCTDLERYAKDGDYTHADKPEKALEWLGDRSNLLAEIEKLLDADGRTGDTDDQVKAMVETLENIRCIVGAPDLATDEDIETAVQELADRPAPLEYDL